MKLIGRKDEKEAFQHCLDSKESKLIAVYGRRRIGKTFLVRNYFQGKIRFEIAGLHNGNLSDQLLHFASTLTKYGWTEASLHPPQTWKAAFDMLERFLNSSTRVGKKVIFLDELPWFDTPRSKFLMAFESFWNGYCTQRNDLVCVICGSAASWMIEKVLKNKGGLHNRVSERIRLAQFNLCEVELFLKEKGINWSQYDITQLYMMTGGVPYYLDAVRKGDSVAKFINRTCFKKDGIFIEEYSALFSSLFDDSERHYQIIEALNTKKSGLTRKQIIEKTALLSGGTLTKTLNELEESGFIQEVVPYQSKQTKTLFKLTDNFTSFYLKFMKSKSKKITQNWTTIVKSKSWATWADVAYERVCYAHIPQIKKALKLEAIECSAAPWAVESEQESAQIDMLIDRADRIINLCEVKFSRADVTIDKAYAKVLRNKVKAVGAHSLSKRKDVLLTMVTAFGIEENAYGRELVHSELNLEDLFLLC